MVFTLCLGALAPRAACSAQSANLPLAVNFWRLNQQHGARCATRSPSPCLLRARLRRRYKLPPRPANGGGGARSPAGGGAGPSESSPRALTSSCWPLLSCLFLECVLERAMVYSGVEKRGFLACSTASKDRTWSAAAEAGARGWGRTTSPGRGLHQPRQSVVAKRPASSAQAGAAFAHDLNAVAVHIT